MHPRVQTRRSEPRIREQQHQSTRTECDAATAQVIDKDGVKGLFGRGLGTRLMTNGVQVTSLLRKLRLITVKLRLITRRLWKSTELLLMNTMQTTADYSRRRCSLSCGS